MALPDVIKAALDQIQIIAKTETVIGDPIIAGDVTLIPVSRVSIGFAAGGTGGTDTKSGAGTGGGISIDPIAFITITKGRVDVVPLSKSDPMLQKILNMAPEIAAKIYNHFGKKDGGEKKGKDD